MISPWSRGCVALDFRGRRCGRRCVTIVPIIFEWDPVRGVGTGGPSANLCRVHNLDGVRQDVRVEVIGGWLGDAWNPQANVWTVLTTVYATKEGLEASPHWWAMRRPIRAGEMGKDEVYDDVQEGTPCPA